MQVCLKENFSLKHLMRYELFKTVTNNGYILKQSGSSGSVTNYQIVGILFARAVLQCRELLACLQSWLFRVLQDPTDNDLIECLVSESLVQKNADTSTLHKMIEV